MEITLNENNEIVQTTIVSLEEYVAQKQQELNFVQMEINQAVNRQEAILAELSQLINKQ
jgi:hypothetical protein